MHAPIVPMVDPYHTKYDVSRRTSIVTPAVLLSRNKSTKSLRDRRRSSGTLSTHSLQKPRKCIGEYYVGKTLGKGASGRVKLGVHRSTGEQVAIKIISKAHLAANPAIEKAVRREIAIMKLIRHPNVMGLVDVIDDANSPDLHLILEYVQGGELFEYLVSKGKLGEAEARHHFQQIILGLDFCHHHLICHRDLKPENLLLDGKNNIKIADFGMASLQPAGSMLETSCGSPHYASPEIVAGMPYNGSASDIWSCGVILFALLTGHLPFDDENIRQLLKKVKVGKYAMPNDISREAQDLIRRILVVDPSKRMTMEQIMAHPWFRETEPANIANLPVPPTASQIGRPVNDATEIDDRILETIKFLWGETRDDTVIRALVSKEHNMQKVVYVLLQQHAERYWQTDHDEDGDLEDEDEDDLSSSRRYRTIISRRSERDRRCMSMMDNGRKQRPLAPWMPEAKDEPKAASRRYSTAATVRHTISPYHQMPEAPPTPLFKQDKPTAMKKSDTFYSRFIKSVLPSRRQSKEIKTPSTPTSESPQSSMSTMRGTLRRKNPFVRPSLPSTPVTPTADATPVPPPKSSLRPNTGTLLQRNKVDPIVTPTAESMAAAPPVIVTNSKMSNIKRLSIRVPNAFKSDTLKFGFGTTNTGRQSHQQQRKQLDMSMFQKPSIDSRVSNASSSPAPPALSDGSTLSSSSSSSSGSISHHPHDKSLKTPTTGRDFLQSPPPPMSSSSSSTYRRRRTSQQSFQSTVNDHRRGSAPLPQAHGGHASRRRPTTPSLLSNSSTITTASSSFPASPASASTPTTPTPKASWLSNLFFFKQPKVCSLAVPKSNSSDVLRLLYRHMNKTMEARFYEKCDKYGASRYKAEIKTKDGKSRQVKCRIEIIKVSSADQGCSVVQFTQQQGDALFLAAAVRQLQESMEQEPATASLPVVNH